MFIKTDWLSRTTSKQIFPGNVDNVTLIYLPEVHYATLDKTMHYFDPSALIDSGWLVINCIVMFDGKCFRFFFSSISPTLFSLTFFFSFLCFCIFSFLFEGGGEFPALAAFVSWAFGPRRGREKERFAITQSSSTRKETRERDKSTRSLSSFTSLQIRYRLRVSAWIFISQVT